ncbi:MAG: acyl carrier protein [Acholeplasmatales bacterium]|jgi:acyl carrier protein|nr:acyl carrier protein [Acholeplasmatales bacterium]
MTVFEKVKSLIVSKLHVEESKIEGNSRILEDLGADSIDVVELIMAIEAEYKVEVKDDDAEKIKTVNDLVQFVESKKN